MATPPNTTTAEQPTMDADAGHPVESMTCSDSRRSSLVRHDSTSEIFEDAVDNSKHDMDVPLFPLTPSQVEELDIVSDSSNTIDTIEPQQAQGQDTRSDGGRSSDDDHGATSSPPSSVERSLSNKSYVEEEPITFVSASAIAEQHPKDDSHISPEDRYRAECSQEFEHSIEDPIDLDKFTDAVIAVPSIDTKKIPINNLGPREQEEADGPVREGMRHLFNNKFGKAKAAFQTKAHTDPLYALGLGAMAFIKAMMTYHTRDINVALNALITAFVIAKSQVDRTSYKKPQRTTMTMYFSSMLRKSTARLPASPSQTPSSTDFMPNHLLRAHVIKAESCLLMGILYMTQESVVGYVKCGLNIRRAYTSYNVVWQEYVRMGQQYNMYMDCDTVSAIQFGVGAVHLLLSSMPAKVLKVFSSLGWKADKELGFQLLRQCMKGDGIRAPLASLALLAYYTILTSFAPKIYADELTAPAVECLVEAQKRHPNSCFFLTFAARLARQTRNLPLSTQSFQFTAESSRGEWAEVAMKQMTDYEIGFNHCLALDWATAAAYFEQLGRERYWSPAFSRYLVGACREMLGQRTEGILAFAEVPQLVREHANRKSYIDEYVLHKVTLFQRTGYQDMDFSLPGLELLLVWNVFDQMTDEALERCLVLVQRTLELIYEREKVEYHIRLCELVPASQPPDYVDQRAVLLLIKASVYHALGRAREGIAHLNWVMDHKDKIRHDTWVIPFAYWEAGMTSWDMGNIKKARKLWQLALACSNYAFEYRMAVRLSLALAKCDALGVPPSDPEPKGYTTYGRKRMPIAAP